MADVTPIKPLDIRGWEYVRDVACADMSMTVGARIATIRSALRWTQAELGARIGVHQNAVSVWEQGKNDPQAIFVFRLARLFRCSMEGLYSGDAPWEPFQVQAASTGAVQCRGQKYLGVRCGRWTRDPSEFCRWHTVQSQAAS